MCFALIYFDVFKLGLHIVALCMLLWWWLWGVLCFSVFHSVLGAWNAVYSFF